MLGKFNWIKFADCNINDPFFDSLKSDYPDFIDWFTRKAGENEIALVFNDEEGIGAFLYLKSENQDIILADRKLSAIDRIKIGTLKLADRYQGQRLGEGALGIALWKWQEEKCDEIYLTVFPKHKSLIGLVERFGFKNIGNNPHGELVFLKSRNETNYSDPYKAFPFINPSFEKAGLIPIEERFHDRLFPYSDLYGNKKEVEEIVAGNGVTKVFIGSPFSSSHYKVGDPVAIYRIASEGQKTYKSVITSSCVITKVEIIKINKVSRMSLVDFISKAGNKTVFSGEELKDIYNLRSNVVLLEMTYNGFFGKGHNVIHKDLKENGLWFDTHPYNFEYTKEEFKNILKMGDINVQNVIIDKPCSC